MNELKNNNIGLKVIDMDCSAKLIKIIKKYRTSAISDIKNDLMNNNYILSCAYSGDMENFENLLLCFKDLTENGYSVELYEHGRKTSISQLKNWHRTMKQNRLTDDDQ